MRRILNFILNMSYTRKVAFNTAAQMIGKVLGTIVSLFTTAILFRFLGVEGIGKYTTAFAFVGFFAVFADFGIQWTLLRELTVNPDKNKVFRNVLAFRIIVAFIVHALSFAAVWFFKYPLDLKLGIGVLNLAWFFTTVNSALVSVFLNNFRLDISVTADFISRVIILGIVYIFSRTGASLNAVFSAYIVGNIVTFLFNLYFVRRFIQLRLEYDWKYWKHIASQAFPIGLVLIFGFVYYKIDSIMLSVLRGMVDVGVYGTAYKLLEVLQTVPSMFLGAAFPLITKYAESKDKRLRGAFQKQFDFLVLIAVPLVIGTFVLAGPIISLIAGSKGSEFLHTSTVTFFGQQITSVTCLKILIFSVGVSFISQLYNYMIVSLGKQKVMIWPTVGFAAFNFLVNLYLIPRYSYLGASVSTLATEMIVCATYYHYTRKFVVLPVALFAAAKVLFAGLLMGAVIYWLNAIGINIFIMVAVAVAVYAFFIMVFGAVPYDMIRQVTRGGQE